MVNLHGLSARIMAVVASVFTAGWQLLLPSSIAYRAAGDGWLIDAVNVVVLLLASAALADIIWHDVLRRGLIWPSFPTAKRHHICVAVYSMLAGAYAIRAFIATGDPALVLQTGLLYVLFSVGIMVEAAALAFEKREEPCRTESSSD